MKHAFTVTQKHIELSKYLLSHKHPRTECCPVALCIREKFPNRCVGKYFSYVVGDFKSQVKHPDQVRMFIRAFDYNDGSLPETLTFELEIP